MRSRLFDIKFVRKSFEVNVGGIHFGEEITPWLRMNITCRHSHSFDVSGMTSIRHIHRIFREDHRIIVSKRDALAAILFGTMRDILRTGLIQQLIKAA